MHSEMKRSGCWLFLQHYVGVFVDHGFHTCNQLFFVALFVSVYIAPTVENVGQEIGGGKIEAFRHFVW